jgi:DNA ligase-1
MSQSQTKKVGIIKQLLSACQGDEAKFIVRSLEGKLRIGLADKTLVVALAHAIVLKGLGMCRLRWSCCQLIVAGDKKVPHDKLAEMLERGAETVKAVYR